MRTLVAAALLCCATAAAAQTPVEGAEAFEADARRCLLKDKAPAECLGALVTGHVIPGEKSEATFNTMVPQITSLLAKWLGKDRVWALHRVREKRLGDLFEERTYIVEDTGGNLIMLDLAFLSRKGRWYVFRFNLNSKSDEISEKLGVRL